MIHALLALLVCQLAGEATVRMADIPVPGPVLGLFLLLVALMLRKGAPEPLERTANGLLSHLSLLFVPAGVGVIAHLERIRADWLPLSAALVGSTALTIIVTAVVFRLVVRLSGQSRDGAGDEV